VAHTDEVQTPRTKRFQLKVVLATAVLATTMFGPTQTASAGCMETALGQTSAAALKPSDVLLGITSPRAGETLLEVPPSESVTFSVATGARGWCPPTWLTR
jgi:hypothetical protein